MTSARRSVQEHLDIRGIVLGPVEGRHRVALVGVNRDAKLGTTASTAIRQARNSRLRI